MPNTAPSGQRAPARDRRAATWRSVVAALAAIYLAHGAFWLLGGRLNEDEGWYLEAARRVYAGLLPYRDFSFTQTPLAPYLYGLPLRLFGGGLWVGRATALLLGLGTLLLTMGAARRLAGPRAAALAGLLLATNAYAVAYLGLVKTYAPAAFLLMAAAWVYTAPATARWRPPLALLLAGGAALTRLSMLPVVAVLAVALLLEARDWRGRAGVLGAGLLSLGLLALPALIDPAAYRFNALDYPLVNQARYHLARRDLQGGATLTATLQAIAAVKLPLIGAIVARWGLAGPLLAAGALAARRGAAPRDRRPLVLALALAAGLLVQLTGAPYAEYAVPFFPLVAVLAGVTLVAAVRVVAPADRTAWRAPCLAALLLAGLATVDAERLVPGVPSPPRQLAAAATLIQTYVPPREPILTFDTYLAVQADRPVPSWLAMSHYSYYRTLPDAEAARYHVVNDAGLRLALAGPPAPLLAATDTTFTIFAPPAPGQPTIRALVDSRYRLVATIPNFGQWSDTLYLYVPREP